jgi:4-diphosphocytidyl-2-C-methyl-D-erythritol kinase
MLAFANAKINIGLNITAKRLDGYHEIETVFYPVKIHDVVELSDSDELNCVLTGNSFPG